MVVFDVDVVLERSVSLSNRLQFLEQICAELERLPTHDPGALAWQRELSVSHDKVGDVRSAQSDLGRAAQAFALCADTRERLSAEDPGNVTWQRDLSVAHVKLGEARSAQGDLDAALQSFEAVLDICERLAAQQEGVQITV